MKTQTQNRSKKANPVKTKNDTKPYIILNWSLSTVFILFALYMTLGQNLDFLRKLQDLDLFVYDIQFFIDSMQRIGGLSMYVGSFLYQFFYYPLAGSLLLLLCLLLISLLTAKTFNLKGWSFSLAYIPSLVLLLTMTELGYMIYFQKIDGYVYDNILSVSIILTGILFFQKIKKRPVQVLFACAYLVLFYPICGAYSLFGGFLMLLVSLKQAIEGKQWISFIPVLVIAVSIIFIPLFYYGVVFVSLAYSDIFTANLPDFLLKGAEMKLWLPFLILAVYFILVVIWKREVEVKKQHLLLKLLPAVLFISCIFLVYAFSYKDKNFNTELSMQTASDNEDWNEVLKLARNQNDEPTRQIVMNTNLALYKLGLAGDKMFHYKNGTKEINSARVIVSVQMAGTMFYYQYGVLNFCNRWCMEGMVEYGLSVSILKYFVLSSLLNGDYSLSQKYNDVLKSTLFYKSWALKYQKYIDNPKSIPEALQFKKILALTAYEDDLTLDFDHLEQFLRIHFSEMRQVPQDLTELSVLFNLDLKNNERFWPRLFRWIRFNPTKKLPIHFQEAAILYGNIEGKDLTGAPFDDAVLANYARFQNMVKQYNGYPEESMKSVFYNQFGNTFWYYYFFVKDPESKKRVDKDYQN